LNDIRSKIFLKFEGMLIKEKTVYLMNKNRVQNCSFKFRAKNILGDERLA
jgi:hypothetical protein